MTVLVRLREPGLDRPSVAELIAVHGSHAHVQRAGVPTLDVVPLTRVYAHDSEALVAGLCRAWDRQDEGALRRLWAVATCLRPRRYLPRKPLTLTAAERALLPGYKEMPCLS